MRRLQFTLVGEGSSDRVLMNVLVWLLRDLLDDVVISPQWGDLRGARTQEDWGLSEKLRCAVDLYPCDILFVHRDSDTETIAKRAIEIATAFESSGVEGAMVCVIPIKETEAWFLFDESAIRLAADKPNGKAKLNLPKARSVERISDPKQRLYEAIRVASERTGRRLAKLRPPERVHLVGQRIDDFSPLRVTQSFESLESSLRDVLISVGFNPKT